MLKERTMDISGATQLLCVIGDPISHSLSPRIHNTFRVSCGADFVYLAFPVAAEGLAGFVQAAKILGIRGFNVTMPHKEAMLSYVDTLSEEARLCGAVNTVVAREGLFHGYNTDGQGFLRAAAGMGFDPLGKKVLILGRGGAAKTIALVLARRGAHVVMAVRDGTLPVRDARIRAVLWEEMAGETANCDLLVNGTPLGMEGRGGGLDQDFAEFTFLDGLPERALVADLVYAPRCTRLLQEARVRGLKVMNGMAHLICQAALSFALFTGAEPGAACVEALLEELR